MDLPLADLLLGLVVFAAICGASAAAAALVVARAAPALAGLPRFLAWAQVATATLIAVHLVPLALGVLSRATVVASAALALAAALRLRRAPAASPAPRARPGARDRPPRDGHALRVLAVAAALVTAGCALALLKELAGQPVTAVDALNFQLPTVAAWIQDGSPWRLAQYYPDYSNATYPHNGNVLLLAAVLPWESTFLARLVAVPFAPLACLAVFAAARELGATRAWATLAAATLASVPILAKVALEGAQTDAPMAASFATGGYFLLRHHRTRERADLVLAAVGLGLAFGTKWYAVTSVAVVLAAWVAARRPRPREVALVAGVIGAAGGFWLVRNWAQTGNPLFPQAVPPLFEAPPDDIRARAGFSLLHYAGDGDAWRCCIRPAFDAYLSLAAAVLILGAALAVRRRPVPAAVVALTAVALLAVYAATPYSAFGPEGRPVLTFAGTRYALPGLLAAAAAAAWAGSRLPAGGRVALAALLGTGVVAGLGTQYELRPGEVLAGAAAAGLAVLAARAALRREPRAAIAAAAALAVAGIVAVEDRMAGRGYGDADPVLAHIERLAPRGREVVLAGVWSTDGISPVLPAFGPRLGNEVRYAGRFEAGLLRRHRDANAFISALRSADLLIVGLQEGGREIAWARAAGWRPVARSPRLALLRAP